MDSIVNACRLVSLLYDFIVARGLQADDEDPRMALCPVPTEQPTTAYGWLQLITRRVVNSYRGDFMKADALAVLAEFNQLFVFLGIDPEDVVEAFYGYRRGDSRWIERLGMA